ncbi:MAG: diguanylate cyclase [Nitrospirae bacterium]|nr:diguanylate cyclase [Nitrospirota bacterium]
MEDNRKQNLPRKRHSILIVDDDVVLLNMYKELLMLEGYICETVSNGKSAINLLNTKRFDVIIIDIVLPDMTGFKLTEKVKILNPDSVVIIMTGFSDTFSYDDAIKAGATDFLKKPFTLKELLVRIEHAIEHEFLRTMSLRDELTGLYNRRGFFTLIEHYFKLSMRDHRGFFILYSDLDDLKKINDALGHTAGDSALMDTAFILKENFRDSDIIARIGGDEFVVAPIWTSGDSIEVILSRFYYALENFNLQKARKYKLLLSTGTAFFDPVSPCSIDELLNQADKSMYKSKRWK